MQFRQPGKGASIALETSVGIVLPVRGRAQCAGIW